jgi:membrane peptidoglycan carboxypeptidase
MRQMMEGVVLYGTGKPAQLDGYSSAGKTGTAQKVDPVTHLYSKTMHIASFAGFAPVNNPVIAVAVIMDSPHGDYYGTAVSAPVFAEVAQQVLEYLGVPHDIPVKPVTKPAKPQPVQSEDDTEADQQEVNELYAAANDLPPDDPLRADAAQVQSAATPAPAQSKPAGAQSRVASTATPAPAQSPPPSSQNGPSQVTISDGKLLKVPSLIGLPMRKVIETAAAAGLGVEIHGDGIAREQAPAPGAMVHTGTKIVVKCTR